MAWARAVAIEKVYLTKENVIHVPFVSHTNDHTAEGVALLDSGATHNFMDKRMVKRLKIGTKELASPRTVQNADGSDNRDGVLDKYTDLKVTVDE